MKSKIIAVISILLIVFFVKIKSSENIMGNLTFVYEQVEQIEHDIYFFDNNRLVSVTMKFEDEIDISLIFDFLTNKSNSMLNEYDTKLIVATQLIDYQVDSDQLILNLTNDFLRYKEEDCYSIYSQLKNSFSNLGFETLIIKIEDVFLSEIGYINIYQGIELYNI